ncbi:MAG: nucleoside recognition domain-containing protein [Siphonobacter sp.]
MALNYLWIAFFLIAFVVALIKLILFGDTEIFKLIIDGMFDSAEVAVMKIALPLAGVMTFFLGILKIGEEAGAIGFLARRIGPFFNRLFPEVPKDHPAHGQMIMNFSANMLGLDNAATPFGLKAMQSLQELNPNKEVATNAQIMFMTLHSAGPVLIPLSIMAQRAIYGAADASDIFIPCLIATYVATLVGLLFVAFRQRINLLDRVILGWLGGLTLVIVVLLTYLSTLSKEGIETFSKVFSNVVLFGFILSFVLAAFRKKVDVFAAFVEGAKGGFETSVRIIPYLVGMLVAIGVLRNSGALGYVVDGFRWAFQFFPIRTEWVDALPTALMHPLSGSGSRAMMIETMKTFGADSFVGRLACIFQGSSDTILYVIALYFGAVNVKQTRYTLWAGLLADLAGIITAIAVGYLFFD